MISIEHFASVQILGYSIILYILVLSSFILTFNRSELQVTGEIYKSHMI